MTRNDYVSTPCLPDDKGQALLDELWERYHALDCNPETGKKVRINSSERRHAEAALGAALLTAGAHFEPRRAFEDWLYANTCDVIAAWVRSSPSARSATNCKTMIGGSNARRKISATRSETLRLMMVDVIGRLPPELTRKSDQPVLEMMAKQR